MNHIPLKYHCLDRFDEITSFCDNDKVKTLLNELRELVFYQMNEIKNQRIEIISLKHKSSWKHYDKPDLPIDHDKKSTIDKPKRTDTMGC